MLDHSKVGPYAPWAILARRFCPRPPQSALCARNGGGRATPPVSVGWLPPGWLATGRPAQCTPSAGERDEGESPPLPARPAGHRHLSTHFPTDRPVTASLSAAPGQRQRRAPASPRPEPPASPGARTPGELARAGSPRGGRDSASRWRSQRGGGVARSRAAGCGKWGVPRPGGLLARETRAPSRARANGGDPPHVARKKFEKFAKTGGITPAWRAKRSARFRGWAGAPLGPGGCTV
jgi:hypothetical protein